MRKWISYSFTWLAAILLIGHSLVPHVHEHSEALAIDSGSCHPEDSCGILGKLFSVDIGGEGHLENFLRLKSYSVTFNNANYELESNPHFYYYYLNIALTVKRILPSRKFRDRPFRFSSHYFLASHTLRAPPLV